jgi:peptide/nickel transport system permease protein
VTAYLVRRSAWACGTVLAAVVLVFFAVRLLPGNPILARFGQHPVPERIEAAMEAAGWNKPLLVQLGEYLRQVFLEGDVGQSLLRPTVPVREELARRFPATVELSIAAMVIALPIGVLVGIAAAVWRNRWPDYVCMSGSLLGVSVPVFFLGICLMSLSEHALGNYFPIGRRLPIGMTIDSVSGLYVFESLMRGQWTTCGEALRHLFLPALALSSIPAAVIARLTRSSMLDVLTHDYVRTARAKGGSRPRTVFRHALPNAAIPIANIAGLQASTLLTGAVLTETVFSWPGIGSYLVEAVRLSDYTVVQGSMLLVATIFAATNLLLDVLYAWLDPRIRISGD